MVKLVRRQFASVDGFLWIGIPVRFIISNKVRFYTSKKNVALLILYANDSDAVKTDL